MGLILPSGPSWAYCTHNLPASLSASTLGALCTTGTDNADGATVQLFSAPLTHDTEYIRLMINGELPSSGNNDLLLTLLIDPSGGTNWDVLIPYLIAGGVNDTSTSGATPAGISCIYDFPIWVPAGASLGLQARSAHSASSDLYVAAFAYGGNTYPASWWCGQRVSAIGISPTSSTGTTHAAGNSGSFSSWSDFGAPLSADCGALQWGVNGPGSTFYLSGRYQFEFGIDGGRIGPPFFRILTGSEAGWWLSTGPIFKSLPAGTQLQVRGACNSTAQGLGVAAYAVH